MRSDPALSALHLLSPDTFVQSAIELERFGYRRYWATEHHTRVQSGSPIVAVAAAAARTTTIRVGTAGVLLAYNSPYRVAKDFSLLTLFFGGRLDLGVTKALVPEPFHSALLDGRDPNSALPYSHKVAALANFVRESRLLEGTETREAPELWLCGTGAESAELAGRLGARYAFHHTLSTAAGASRQQRLAVVERYHRTFCSQYGSHPYCAVACFGLCADSHESAQRCLRAHGHAAAGDELFLGTSEQCATQLAGLASDYGVAELVIECPIEERVLRWRSFELLAEVFALKARQPVATHRPVAGDRDED